MHAADTPGGLAAPGPGERADPPERGAPDADPLDELSEEPPDDLPGDPGDLEELPPVYPPVVAMVVTRNPGDWFDEALDSLVGQDYSDLTVLVVDCGSDADPTPRVAARLPRAFVRRLESSAGFAEAANEALRAVEGATFLVLCHDDVVLAPDVVRLLVEEAYRSNAGIVGPKLVSADDPEVLLDVGRAIDRFGAPFTGIEPGELDQEQHDGVRDVFYVTTATMLVRVDLFAELGGFDPATFPGAEDLDLCWRARLAGARVLVAPDARVRHHEAAEQRNRGDRPEEAALARSRIRVLLTSYSLPTLLWLVPVGLLVAVAEAAGDLVVGRPRRARAIVGAWIGNLVHFRQLRGSRARAQSRRRIHDRDLRELHVRTSARVGAWFGHHLHTDTRLRTIGDRSRTAVDAVSDGVRAPATVAFVVFLALVLFGSRHFVTSDVPSIGTLVSWPGIGDLFDAFGSAWRYTGVGSASAAPPALALMGALGTVFLGAVSMARTVLVVVAIPLGSFGAYRLVRRVVGLQGPAFASALAYGVNPVSRNAIAQGRLGPLMVYVTLPFVLAAVARISRLDDGESPPRRGRVLRLAVLVALATAWYPTAPALFLLAGLVLVVVAPLTGHVGRSVRALGILAAAGVGAVVLLFPWPLAYLGSPDAASFGFAFHPHLVLGEVLRFQTGPNGAGWAMWGLIGAAAVPLFTATGTRLAWAARGWMLALAGWAAVWVPARFAPARAVLAPEAPLTLAALGLAIALGIGVAVLVDGIRAFRFGWRQPAVLLGGVALLLPALGFVADTFDGRWHAPTSAWSEELSFTAMGSNRAEGQFRMLWIGDPAVLPLDPVTVAGGVGYSLSRNGVGDATELLRAPEHDADEVVDEAIDLSRVGRTNRLGRLLAPVGVRYVVLPRTQGPGGGARADAAVTGRIRAALDGQLDLARLRSESGFVLYENLAWYPLASVVTGPAADEVPVGSNDPLRAALSTDLAGRAHPVLDGAPVPPGTVLFGEAYDVDWRIEDGSARSRHTEAFGLVNGFELGRRSTVSFAFGGQYQRWLLLAASVVIWLAVIVRWRRTRERTRPVGSPRSRRERAPTDDPLTQVLDEDAYWWERV